MAHGGKRVGAGRPKGSREAATKKQQATIAELARSHAPAALKALVEISRECESPSARVAASNSILDRAFGKPVQAMDVSNSDGSMRTVDVSKLSMDQRKALLAAVILDEPDPNEG